MKRRLLASVLAVTLFLGIQMQPFQVIQAAEARTEADLLQDDEENLEEGSYVEGEALVSVEAGKDSVFKKEGICPVDSNVKIASVSDFGLDEKTGKEICIAHLTSKRYSTEELMDFAGKQKDVDGVCANQYQQVCEADPCRNRQWALDGTDVKSPGIHYAQTTITDKESAVIAVIDTGVNYKHPDLADSMWVNPYPDKLPGTYGYDFGNGDADPMDENGHGTHVSGIAAAQSDNGIGITGISDAKIMALKAVADGSETLTLDAVISAYEYVYDAMKAGVSVKAVNCSWYGGGGASWNTMLKKVVDAVGKKGALSVFGAGNDGINCDDLKNQGVIPYAMESPYVIVVGATEEQDQVASYSNYGKKSVDIFAPGSNILSTYCKNLYMPGIYDSDTRNQLSVYFNRFSDSEDNILPAGQTYQNCYTAGQLGLETDYTVKQSNENLNGNACLKLSITRNLSHVKNGEVGGSIYVDVTDLNLDQNLVYYVSYMNGMKTHNQMNWQCQNMVSKPGESRFVSKDGRTYLRIVGLVIPWTGIGQEYTWYLDDIAISAGNTNPESFGAYAYLSGTSMATPAVSGAVAALGAANPKLSAVELRSLLLGSARKADSVSDKCISGGILDMANLKTVTAKVKINKTSAVLRYGKKLQLTSNAKVSWKSANTKYAVVDSKGIVKAKKAGIGHTVTITGTAKDKTGRKVSCKVKIKK